MTDEFTVEGRTAAIHAAPLVFTMAFSAGQAPSAA